MMSDDNTPMLQDIDISQTSEALAPPQAIMDAPTASQGSSSLSVEICVAYCN